MANRGELYSGRVDAESGRRCYFFNIKRDRRGALFMTIVESTKRAGENEFTRNEIFLYEEDVDRFGSQLMHAMGRFREIKHSREQQ